jgi:segregation and condensation protein B
MSPERLQQIIEAALLASDQPLSVQKLATLFSEDERPEPRKLMEALEGLAQGCTARGIELKQVASGYRFQVKQEMAPWVSRLWDERPARYSRALLETLALIAYRQPITRAEIEDVRGVSVSTSIIRTLQEREWIRVVGHREVPGRPAMFGTTRQFLDEFSLRSLDELPTLPELRDLEEIGAQINDHESVKPTREMEEEPVAVSATLDNVSHEDTAVRPEG